MNIEVELITEICKNCGNINTRIKSNDVSNNNPPSLWMGKTCNHFNVIEQDAYYDIRLRDRYNANNMICLVCNLSRIVEIGLIYNGDGNTCDKCKGMSFYELSRVKLIGIKE